MLFGRKKKPKKRRVRKKKGSVDMIDIRELHKRGQVLGPDKQMPDLDTDKEGYVNMGASVSKTDISKTGNGVSSSNVTTFMDVGSGSSFSTEKDGYSKREVDAKIQELDSQIYKLEQRIDVLERKLGIDSGYSASSSSSNTSAAGLIGW